MADVGHSKHVFERHGLTTTEVGTRLHTYEGNVLGTLLLDDATQALEVEVALEGVVALGLETLLGHELLYGATHACDVCLSGGEVEVHQCSLSRLH